MTQWVELPAGDADQLATKLTEVMRGAAREGQVAVVLDTATGALDIPGPAGEPGWERTVWAPLLQRLRSSQTAVLVVTRGQVSGLGLALCLAVDLCVTQEDATFCAGQAGALSGGIAWHLHRLGGAKLAARLLLAGQQLSAAQAVGHGVVTESAPADSVRHTVETLLAPLQNGALGGLLLRSHRHAGHLDLAESIDYDIQLGEVAHAGT